MPALGNRVNKYYSKYILLYIVHFFLPIFSFYRKDCQILHLDACNRNPCCLYNTIIK